MAGRRRPGAVAWGPLALAALLGACDPQADADYRGEPLVVLRGRVTRASDATPLEAAMLWQRGPPPSSDDVELATRAPVEPGFPATFTLRLYQPPPAAARRSLAPGEVTFARANAAAIPYGIAAPTVSTLPAAAAGGGAGPGAVAYGADASHWVVWLDAPAPAGSLTAWWLGAPLPAGYALLRLTEGCPAPAELAACLADLVARGVPEDGSGAPGTAGGFCRAPYRLAPAPAGEEIVLELGDLGLLQSGSACP